MKVLKMQRPHEQDYRNELIGLQREINFLLAFMWEHNYQRFFAPMVRELTQKETLIKQALCKPTLLPLPDEWRNPFTRPRTPAETEYIKKLGRKYNRETE